MKEYFDNPIFIVNDINGSNLRFMANIVIADKSYYSVQTKSEKWY